MAHLGARAGYFGNGLWLDRGAYLSKASACKAVHSLVVKGCCAWMSAAKLLISSGCICPRRFARLARERVQRARPSVWIARAILRRRISWRRGRSGRRSTRGTRVSLLLPGPAEAESAAARPCGGACSGGAMVTATWCPRARTVTRRKVRGWPGNYLRWQCGAGCVSPDELSGRFAVLEKLGRVARKKVPG